MALSNYETVFIAEPDISNDQVDQIVQKIAQAVTSRQGSMTGEDRWGRKRLAYPIQGHRAGFYTILKFTAEGAVVSDLDHYFRVTGNVLRHLTTKVIKSKKTFAPRREKSASASSDHGRPGGTRSFRPRSDRPAAAPAPAAAPVPAAVPAAEVPKAPEA